MAPLEAGLPGGSRDNLRQDAVQSSNVLTAHQVPASGVARQGRVPAHQQSPREISRHPEVAVTMFLMHGSTQLPKEKQPDSCLAPRNWNFLLMGLLIRGLYLKQC